MEKEIPVCKIKVCTGTAIILVKVCTALYYSGKGIHPYCTPIHVPTPTPALCVRLLRTHTHTHKTHTNTLTHTHTLTHTTPHTHTCFRAPVCTCDRLEVV